MIRRRIRVGRNGDRDSSQVTITGSGFGVAPNVVIYRTLDGSEDNTLSLAPGAGEIGTFTSATMKYGPSGEGAKGRIYNGSIWTKGEALHDSLPNFRRYRSSYSLKVPDGYYPPGNNAGYETWPTSSDWKPTWLIKDGGDGSLDGLPDLVLGSSIGSGAMGLVANSCKWRTPGGQDIRYWDYEASTNKPSHHWSWNNWNIFVLVADADETNPQSTDVTQKAWFTSPQTGASKTTGTKEYTWTTPGFDESGSETLLTADCYFNQAHYNSFCEGHTTTPELNMVYWRDIYLAIESSYGANDYRQACFLGNAAALADCTRIKPKVATSWSDTSVTIPVSVDERIVYTHAYVQKADGTVVTGVIA